MNGKIRSRGAEKDLFAYLNPHGHRVVTANYLVIALRQGYAAHPEGVIPEFPIPVVDWRTVEVKVGPPFENKLEKLDNSPFIARLIRADFVFLIQTRRS